MSRERRHPLLLLLLLLPSLASVNSIMHVVLTATSLRCASASRVISKEGETATEPSSSITFFMHDILGGSAPSGRVVVGTVANAGVTNLPFSKPNKGLFPPNGGIPLVGQKVPLLSGAGGNLVFGTITVIDDEITVGQELGLSVIGKAQGFHLASSLDGSSRTMAFTVIFGDSGGQEEEEEDSISLFGVHRSVAPVSFIAIIGGTGKYAEASGYAEIETLHGLDKHITDGVETLLQINVHLTK